MIPTVAKAYGMNLMNEELPKGLKQYLELQLFPRIHMKATRGVSISTARRWLYHEGFCFTKHFASPSTKKHYILMDMSGQTWWSTDRKSSYLR